MCVCPSLHPHKVIRKSTWIREQKCCCHGGNEGFAGIGGEGSGGEGTAAFAEDLGSSLAGSHDKYLLTSYYVPDSRLSIFKGLSQLSLLGQPPKVDMLRTNFTDGEKLRFRELMQRLTQGNWVSGAGT